MCTTYLKVKLPFICICTLQRAVRERIDKYRDKCFLCQFKNVKIDILPEYVITFLKKFSFFALSKPKQTIRPVGIISFSNLNRKTVLFVPFVPFQGEKVRAVHVSLYRQKLVSKLEKLSGELVSTY